MNFVMYIENLAPNGTASQSTTYYSINMDNNLTTDLAINGGPANTFSNPGCYVTWSRPFQRFAWWMLTFPLDTVYVTNVTIYYRSNSKFSYLWEYQLSCFSLMIYESLTKRLCVVVNCIELFIKYKLIVNKVIMGGTRKINSNGALVYFVVYGLIRFQCYFTIVSCKTGFM